MRICMPHWGELRAEIAKLGLDHLVSKTGEVAVAKLVGELEGEKAVQTFDPLMGANNAIFSQFLYDRGLGAFVGDLCPLCEVEKGRAGLARNWIEGSVTDQRDQAKELGLLVAS